MTRKTTTSPEEKQALAASTPANVLADKMLSKRTEPLALRHVNEHSALQILPNAGTLNGRHVSYLIEQFGAGLACDFQWLQVRVKDHGDQLYNADGQHSSHALNLFHQVTGTLPKVDVTIERYEVETLEEAAALSSTYFYSNIFWPCQEGRFQLQ